MSWVQPSAARQRRLLSEVLLVAGMFAVYNLGRVVAARHGGDAFGNADQVWSAERRLRLPSEQAVQAWLLDQGDWLARAANGYYAVVHFPLTFGVLAWLFWRRPTPYRWIRTAMIVATAAAMAIHLAYPLAPPRMMADLGFVDTGLTFGLSVYGPPGANSVANQFAAMPSLHVGWSVLVAVGMITAARSRWRLLWAAHPVATTLVVVVTANHYWLDALVGVALVTGALLLPRRRPFEPPVVGSCVTVAPRPRGW